MKLYIEFDGQKLSGTECFSYQEARFVLHKILDKCIVRYAKTQNKKIFGHEELKLHDKILAKLKLVRLK